jgi:ring-1,2-phenylacetyl-CoA epoxidase subunit PaaA
MSATVPLCESIGVDVPAHYDAATEQYVLDFPFPCQYDAAAKRWDFDGGKVTWERVFERWKARGPMNEIYVESVRRSHGVIEGMMRAA